MYPASSHVVSKATNASGSLAKHERRPPSEDPMGDAKAGAFFRLVIIIDRRRRARPALKPNHLSAANESVVRTSQHTAIHQSGKTIQMAFATITVATLPTDAPTSYLLRR